MSRGPFSKYIAIVAITLLIGSVTIYIWLPKPSLGNQYSYSTAIFDRHGELLRLTLAKDQRYRLATPIEQIPQAMRQATILYEDQNYYSHLGIDIAALLRAFWQTYITQERRIGASTIVMQVARLRWRISTGSISGKLEQMARALQLSRHYSKDEILEAYFNLASYGGNIEGVGAASLIYFNKPVHQLSTPEALTLAVIPQNPNKRNPATAQGFAALRTARERLFTRWQHYNLANEIDTTTVSMPLKVRSISELPFNAPHFVEHVLTEQSPMTHGYLQTSLDMPLQLRLEQILRSYVLKRHNEGFSNASALLLNTDSMEIEAMLGSASFFDAAIEGQVNGTLAKRSPGSTLKPFVYGLALDAGIIHPATILKDLPRRFGGFTPENFGGGFKGPISAQQALIASRNVPAVALQAALNDVSSDRSTQTFYQMLERAGIEQLQAEEHYGLALALGGGEVTMLELIQLYAMLNNNGMHQAANIGIPIERPDPEQLLSPEAAFLLTDMLQNNPNPLRSFAQTDHNLGLNAQPIAWKTGTSWAYRDAWAVGVVGNYALAVWIGNFNGQGNPAFVGAQAAGPLLFQMLEIVQQSSRFIPAIDKLAIAKNLNLKRIDVCRPSGDLYTPACPEMTQTWFIPGVSPIRASQVYRFVAIDPATGLRACNNYAADTIQQVYAFWPSDMTALFQQAGIFIQQPPAFNPECDINYASIEGHAPIIQSPDKHIEYLMRDSQQATVPIVLQASADADTQKLYWFANQQFVGESTPIANAQQPLVWDAKPGVYELHVSDDLGRSSSTNITVRSIH
ncbi:penicillin-binding protein 1C [Alteromonas sp. ASW11-36]|uniref:peptidoglycan glycosyltransferase n=1 Tax=Alteromonas arenosi TaxID=3055817 RepID=A0ABT7T155_9ALTE|nr:penicillin-binding protein 1C [Alteromonas sp. ASW11-36]MDM7862110.1 penicillin-binding protein 1C [Alteromonas sp. ASW11-36]